MTRRLVITHRARADTLEAFRWIATRSPAAAARWLAGLERALARLADRPERQPIAEDEAERFGRDLRQLLYGRRRGVYRILFIIEDETVTIHSIRHGARGPIED